MKKSNIFACILFILILSGCQQVPDEVKVAAGKYNENEQKNDTEFTYTDIYNLQESANEALMLEPENLILPASVDFTDISSVNKITMEYCNGFTESKDSIADFFNIENPVWTKLDIPLNNEITYSFDSESDRKCIIVSNNGFFAAILPPIYDYYDADTTTFTCLYEGDTILDSNIEITLNGNKTTLGEQAEFVTDWLNNDLKFNEKDLTYKIDTVVSRKSDSNDILTMEIAKYYEGVLLDNCSRVIETSNQTVQMKLVTTSISLALANTNSIDCFSTDTGTLIIKDKEVINQFLDLSSAVKIIEKELSGFNTLNIAEIKIVYTLEPVYDAEKVGANYQEPGGTVLCNPVYSFRIKKEYDNCGITGISTESMYYVINVDMVTGELVTNIDMNAYDMEE